MESSGFVLLKTVLSRHEVEEEAKQEGMAPTRTTYGGRSVNYKCSKNRCLISQSKTRKCARFGRCRVTMYSVEDDDGAFHLYINPSIPHEHLPVPQG